MRFMMLVKSAENSGPPPKELKNGRAATRLARWLESVRHRIQAHA
jgi:hypothetical protein